MCFDGPRAPEQAAAADLAGRQRIWPAIRGLSGLVNVYVLRGSDLGSVVITLATSVDTLDAAQRAVMATELRLARTPRCSPAPTASRSTASPATTYPPPDRQPA